MTMEIGEAQASKTYRQEALEARFGDSIENILRSVYEKTGSIQNVGEELGLSRRTIYKWFGREKIASWKIDERIKRQQNR
jgi:transcriptional regulator of acetoin/glycerol metabolism